MPQRTMPLSRWLQTYAVRVDIQAIEEGKRRKNCVILQYRDRAGTKRAVGGYTVIHAVKKACARMI